MPAYLGAPGQLVEFKCSPTTVTEDRPSTYRRTMGGRVKAQRATNSRRTWSVDISTATPGQLAGLMALLHGGTPPWVYVDPYAQVTNLYTPDQAALLPGTWEGTGFVEGGAVTVDGLTLPRSVATSTANTVRFGFKDTIKASPAVVPGLRVTGSAYLRGNGTLVMFWQDANNVSLGSTSVLYNVGALTRVACSGVAPAGAVSAQLNASGALQAAGPAVTWTETLADWSMGRGCTAAVAEGLSEAVQMAVRAEAPLRRSQISFTVREVG